MPLFFLFVVVPLVELMLLIQVGGVIGTLPTILICVATGAAGARLAKVEGRAALQRMNQAVYEGRVPTDDIVDGLLILVAGALLLTPGYLTDATGLLLLFPPSRALIRPRVARWFLGHAKTRVANTGAMGAGFGSGPSPFGRSPFGRSASGSSPHGTSGGPARRPSGRPASGAGSDQEVYAPSDAPRPPNPDGPVILDG